MKASAMVKRLMFLFMEKLQRMHGQEYGEVSSITFKNELDELRLAILND